MTRTAKCYFQIPYKISFKLGQSLGGSKGETRDLIHANMCLPFLLAYMFVSELRSIFKRPFDCDCGFILFLLTFN